MTRLISWSRAVSTGVAFTVAGTVCCAVCCVPDIRWARPARVLGKVYLLLPGLLEGEKPALVKGPHAVVEGHVPQAVLPQHADEAIVFNARTGQDTRDAAV